MADNPNTQALVVQCTPALKKALKRVAVERDTNVMQLVRDILGAHPAVAAAMVEADHARHE